MGVFLNLSTSKTHKGFGQIFKHIKALVVSFKHIKALIECHVLIGHMLIKNECIYSNTHISCNCPGYENERLLCLGNLTLARQNFIIEF